MEAQRLPGLRCVCDCTPRWCDRLGRPPAYRGARARIDEIEAGEAGRRYLCHGPSTPVQPEQPAINQRPLVEKRCDADLRQMTFLADARPLTWVSWPLGQNMRVAFHCPGTGLQLRRTSILRLRAGLFRKIALPLSHSVTDLCVP